jgi:transaldolase
MTTPLLQLKALGQSIWLDYIQRGMLDSGELARLIEQDGLAGVTSNPAIFEKAIAHHDDYDAAIADLKAHGADAQQAYEELAIDDVRHAADLLVGVFRATDGRDGYVSLEVAPTLARDTEGTVREAKRLWQRVDRPNLMIKVPATVEGLPAIRDLIAAGVNVNATLLFSVTRYKALAEAYMAGLEARAAAGQPLSQVASVASFFLSRIDSTIDPLLDAQGHGAAESLRGQTAIASARLAYQVYKDLCASLRWQRLQAQGARTQRLLWASTSTKDPAYDDLKYITPLIGPDTVNTLTPETLAAFRDHGVVATHVEDDMNLARGLPSLLDALGIDLKRITDQLEEDGIKKFITPYEKLLATLAARLAA